MVLIDRCRLWIPLECVGRLTSKKQLLIQLESKDDEDKENALKKILVMVSNGIDCKEFLIPIIKFILPITKNKIIKRLLLLYLEMWRYNSNQGDGGCPEILLICNGLRNDLKHPNEYVQGFTSRFISHVIDPEVADFLIPCLKENLNHGHSYVRQNAYLAISEVYRNRPDNLPDGSELLEKCYRKEKNPIVRFYAFCSLVNCAPERAKLIFNELLSNIPNISENTKNEILYFIKMVGSYIENIEIIPQIINLISTDSISKAMLYTCASILSKFNDGDCLLKCYEFLMKIILAESNINTKYFILDKIESLLKKDDHIFIEKIIDLLDIGKSNNELRKRCFNIVLKNLTLQNYEPIMGNMISQFTSEFQSSFQKSVNIVNIITFLIMLCFKIPKAILIVYPNIHNLITYKLLEIQLCNIPLLIFLALDNHPLEIKNIASDLVLKICEDLPLAQSPTVIEGWLWFISEVHHNNLKNTNLILDKLLNFCNIDWIGKNNKKLFFSSNNYPVPLSLAISITKIKLNILENKKSFNEVDFNRLNAKCLLIMVKSLKNLLIINMDLPSSFCKDAISFHERIINIFSKNNSDFIQMEPKINEFFKNNRQLLFERVKKALFADYNSENTLKKEPLYLPQFQFLSHEICKKLPQINFIWIPPAKFHSLDVENIFQLTALSDPVFAEAHVYLERKSIIIDTILINQTDQVLRDAFLELSFPNKRRYLFTANNRTILPNSFARISSRIKINSSLECSLNPTLGFEPTSVFPSGYLTFSTINLNLKNYLSPIDIGDKFPPTWKFLEWERKVEINIKANNFDSVIEKISQATNLLPQPIGSNSSFQHLNELPIASINFVAISVFDEYVLCNVSLEMNSYYINGQVRIRSKCINLVKEVSSSIDLIK